MTAAILPPIPLYLSYAANETADAVTTTKSSPEAQSLIAHFQATAAKITTPKQLLSDYKSLSVVLGAFGLSNQINNTALLNKLLTQNPSAKGSLASQLGAKYLQFAKAISTWNTGTGTGATKSPFAQAGDRTALVTAYEVNNFEASVNSQAPGLQDALYFTRKIASVTSVTQLQSDPTLLAVAVTTAGLPLTNFQVLSFAQQTHILTTKINLKNFQNPADVKRAAEQYLVSQQTNVNTTAQTVAPGSLLSLFGGSDTTGNSIISILQTATGDSISGTTASTSAASAVLSLVA
jgi:hypothetical protein